MSRFLLISILVVSVACTSCGDPADADRIAVPDSVMVKVLADLHVADAENYLEAREQEWPSTEDGDPVFATGNVRDSVLAAHEVSGQAFQSRIDQLLENPDHLLSLYEQVLDVLNVRASR